MRGLNLLIHDRSLACLQQDDQEQLNDYSRHETNDGTKTTRADEERDLHCFVVNLLQCLKKEEQIKVLDEYYWNYRIPQISKEFDLIRIGTKYLVNIELKSKADDKKMREQLEKNLVYLKIMGKPVYQYTFRSDDEKLFTLDEEGFHETQFYELAEKLRNQAPEVIHDIDEIFSPLQYLISPFNNTDQFLNDEYFLTKHQEQIQKEILSSDSKLHILYGKAGTGKSLMLYHIAKCMMQEGKNTVIVHCGNLNEGHEKLKAEGYQIFPVKEFENADENHIEVLLVDECQRIYKHQLDHIVTYAKENNILCILCEDPVQVFDQAVKNFDMHTYCMDEHGFIIHRLTDHIRYNPDISRFAKDIMDLSDHHALIPSDHIHVFAVSNYEEASETIHLFENAGYSFINYTGTFFQKHSFQNLPEGIGNVHEVIGQEYDQVVTFLDEHFYYDDEGHLCAHTHADTPYLRPEMFYEAITRSRRNLAVVVINNDPVFQKMIHMFSR